MEQRELIKLVKQEFLKIPISELLTKRPSVLIDVSEEQADTLKHLKINNLYDLGLSDIFQNARYITSISNKNLKPNEAVLPGDMVAEKALLNSLSELKLREPALLTGVGEDKAGLLKSDFGFRKIEDLATWRPYYAARLIVNDHLGIPGRTAAHEIDTPDAESISAGSVPLQNRKIPTDPEAPQELVPKMGEYPVEVVYYDNVVIIDAPKKNDQIFIPGRIALSYNDRDMGYDKPGFGAIFTFKQSWFAEGITLGSLIKSIALAPGESTKIAVIDWQRKTTGTTTEATSQMEQLANSETQNRAISEVANATATEIQGGSSMTGSISTSSNVAMAGGALLGGMGIAGGSASTSVNTTAAASVTASAGRRDVVSGMHQNIDNSTQQNSFSSRNKRSAVISEVSQSESETITTRSITNYNHMHALTIQYWQVVQSYTTELKVDRYKRCIFIPMDIINFEDERIINKFKSVLYATARSEYIKHLLIYKTNYVDVAITATPLWSKFIIPEKTGSNEAEIKSIKIEQAKTKLREFVHFKAIENFNTIFNYNREARTFKMYSNQELINIRWYTDKGDALKRIIVETEDGNKQTIDKNGAGISNITVPIAVSAIVSLTAEFENVMQEYEQRINFSFKKPLEDAKGFDLNILVKKDKTKVALLSFDTPLTTENVGALLNEDALYYSQHVWMNMDPNFLSMQLSPYKLTIGSGSSKREISLTEYIDPKPIAVMGNCLGFIFHNEDDAEWKEWITDNMKNNKPTIQKIALPTDGIFGEAVLGRFNSAEKLDMTRFWNWQDSPIPFAAPEIAAIQAGQHTVEGVQRAGNLDAPVLNIQSPQSLPDPVGIQGVLQAITAANLFRDMSGIAQTSALAQNALNASSSSAVATGSQASANMATFANLQVEMAKIAASLAPMLLGLPPLPTPATKTMSGSGAALNAAKSLDAQQSPTDTDQGISPESIAGTSTPKSAPNQQKVLDKVLGIPSNPAPIILPSPNPGSASVEKDVTVNTRPESKQIDNIIKNAANTGSGSLSGADEQKITQLMKDDFNKNIKPLIEPAASDFEQLKPVLGKLLEWMAKAEATGLDDNLTIEKNEGLQLAKKAMFVSLNNAVDRSKENNDIKQVRTAFDVAGNAQLMGFDATTDGFSPDALLSALNLSLIVNTSFDTTIADNQERVLKINVLLKIDNNNGTPVDKISVGISVTGGTALPVSTGSTNEFGNFTCNIQCTNRGSLAIEGLADAGIAGLQQTFSVPL